MMRRSRVWKKPFKKCETQELPITEGYSYIPYLENMKSKTEKYEKESKLAKAYEVALDTRKFEIELYWKRATYFWAIAAVVLGAIGLVIANSIKDGRLTTYPILFMLETLSCVGFIVTKAWQYVNLGGKFWQHNWELHVDVLEQEVLFPMFRTVIAECSAESQTSNDAKSASHAPDNLMVVFSPSKVNDHLGRFLNMIFIVVGLSTFALILSKAGVSALFAEMFGIYDMQKYLPDAKIWLVSLVAFIPVGYTIYFWIEMAGNARTTTLNKHSLNVTQRQIYVKEKIELPVEKERGFLQGIDQVKSELKWYRSKTKTAAATKKTAQ
jgi:hypothetical protein